MMEKNKLFLFGLLLITGCNLFAQKISSVDTTGIFNVEPKVDKRVELLSIVFRLAGNEEYNEDFFKSYIADINKHFEPYKTHPLIGFAKQLAQEKGIRYSTVMSMAIQLEQPPLLTPVISFKQKLPEQKWQYEDAIKFDSLLKQFYAEAKFESFFSEHTPLYKLVTNRFDNLIRKVDFNWYKEYYGKLPDAKFNLVIGVGNGGGNYGPKLVYPDGKEELYAIIGTSETDSLGRPVYDEESTLPLIIHEYNHSFVNSLIDDNSKKLEEAGRKIFDRVSEQMEKMAYGNWKIMMYEALVRASVVRYMKKHEKDSTEVQDLIHSEEKNGFVWISDLINLLDYYESNRNRYLTLQSFMARIVTFYNQLAIKIDSVKDQVEKKMAHVVSIEPFKNNTQDVDTAVTEIIINFDKSLDPKHYSIRAGEGGQEQMPITDFLGFTNNNMSLRLKVSLKANKEYSFILGPKGLKRWMVIH